MATLVRVAVQLFYAISRTAFSIVPYLQSKILFLRYIDLHKSQSGVKTAETILVMVGLQIFFQDWWAEVTH